MLTALGHCFVTLTPVSFDKLQVVRYHSLVIDAESLPNELIPIAWTTSADALSFHKTPKSDGTSDASADSFSTNQENGSSRPLGNSNKVQKGKGKVLMGIMHSNRPHYGLQVCYLDFLYDGYSSFHCSTLLIIYLTSVSSRECCNLSWKANIQEL